MSTQRSFRAGDPVASDSDSTRASARRRLLAGGVAATALGAQWVTPIVDSAILPAHAQATGGRVWTYSNNAVADDQSLEAGDVGTGSSPCVTITGPVLLAGGTTRIIRMGCQRGPFEIVSWIVNGEQVIGSPVGFNSGAGGDDVCATFFENLSAALASADPNGGWTRQIFGAQIFDGGCGTFTQSDPHPDGVTYGQLVIEDRFPSDPATFILQPMVRTF